MLCWWTRSMTDDTRAGRIHACDNLGTKTACGREISGPRWCLDPGKLETAPTCSKCIRALKRAAKEKPHA